MFEKHIAYILMNNLSRNSRETFMRSSIYKLLYAKVKTDISKLVVHHANIFKD